MKKAVDYFRKTLQERYNDFVANLDSAINAIAVNGLQPPTLAAMVSLASAADNLSSIIVPGQQPQWLRTISDRSRSLVDHANSAQAQRWLSAITRIRSEVSPIVMDDLPEAPLDFDSIYRNYRDEGELPKLFDELIRILTEIIESEQVDSNKVLQTLQHMLALLKANSKGSFIAAKVTILSSAYFWNLAKALLKDIPGIRHGIEAYDMTQLQAKKEIDKIENEMFSIAVERVKAALPQPKLLAVPTKPAIELESDNIIDAEFTETKP